MCNLDKCSCNLQLTSDTLSDISFAALRGSSQNGLSVDISAAGLLSQHYAVLTVGLFIVYGKK